MRMKSILSRRAFAMASAAVMAAAHTDAVLRGGRDHSDHRQGHHVLLLANRACRRRARAGKDLGVNVPELGARAESDVNGQISILENAVAGKPAAIVISPTEFKALGKPIDEAAKSVPIIGIDSAADSKAFKSFLTTDNVQGSRIAADGLAAAIKEMTGKEEGEVVILTSLPGVGSLEQRREGFLDQVKTKYPGLKVIADKYGDGQATTGLNMMTDLITASPNLVGAFASNLILGQGVGQAIAENKLGDKIKVIAADWRRQDGRLPQDGSLAGLVVQDPIAWAMMA